MHVISLSNLAQRPGEETQQIPHSHVVSCGRRASQSGHVCRADCRCRYRRRGQVAAEGARYGSNGDAVVFSPGVSLAEFTAKFEGVCAFRPAERVAVRPHRGDILVIACSPATERLFALEVHRPPCPGPYSQPDEHWDTGHVGIERRRSLSGFGIVQRIEGVPRAAPHPRAGFVDESRRQRGYEIE